MIVKELNTACWAYCPHVIMSLGRFWSLKVHRGEKEVKTAGRSLSHATTKKNMHCSSSEFSHVFFRMFVIPWWNSAFLVYFQNIIYNQGRNLNPLSGTHRSEAEDFTLHVNWHHVSSLTHFIRRIFQKHWGLSSWRAQTWHFFWHCFWVLLQLQSQI